MTDRIAAFVVVLADDIREDDAEATLTALRMVKGVVEVTPHVADSTMITAAWRVNEKWRKLIYDMLDRESKTEAY